jgi:hypothetical protein
MNGKCKKQMFSCLYANINVIKYIVINLTSWMVVPNSVGILNKTYFLIKS